MCVGNSAMAQVILDHGASVAGHGVARRGGARRGKARQGSFFEATHGRRHACRSLSHKDKVLFFEATHGRRHA
jgi:hypothetical protein